ncbi:MAG: ABC transporter permease [Planctomycetes bacterium]|nr:ABC transporter permease [Planctomycetota bacterium]
MSQRKLAISGLFLDSTLQVLDNKVFRVLVGLAILPILITFVVGIREDSFSLLFGLWELDYPNWISMLGDDPRSALIELFLDVVVNSIAGSMGITVCVAATAFFVPRMLEKGSADLVFTKPLGRSVLFLSRYVTGLFFIAALGLFLTVGMYLGVLIASGLSYPGILWSSLTLVYIFALVHGVTMLIGLLTRSTPAAMILGIMFFFGNGCVHTSWQIVDQFTSEDNALANAMALEEDDGSGWDTVKNVAIGVLDGLHYVLPKTSDAPLVVLHTQEALFSSGRIAAREEMLDSFEERQVEERTKRNARLEEAERKKREERQQDPDDSYFERQFSWRAEELRYNAWFSVLSSLLFTVMVLGVGCWRIRRMDF